MVNGPVSDIFVCSSRIEIAYKEAVALKRQEELIREEEEAELAENEMREKRAKKKQVICTSILYSLLILF